MKIKDVTFIVMNICFVLLIVIFPEIASSAENEPVNIYKSIFVNFGPVILLVVAWILYMNRSGIGGKPSKDYIKRLYIHMEKNEELLERIAKAVEKDNKISTSKEE